MSLVVYYTDALIYILLLAGLTLLFIKRNSVLMKRMVQRILSRPRYIVSGMFLLVFIIIGLLDTVHLKLNVEAPTEVSILDLLLEPQNSKGEVTYSAPFATHSFVPEIIKTETGKLEEVYPRLELAGQSLKDPLSDKRADILKRLGIGLFWGLMISLVLFLLAVTVFAISASASASALSSSSLSSLRTFGQAIQYYILKTKSANLSFWITLTILICLVTVIAQLMFEYHILGTDKIGRDVFYISLKSIRTGLIIGSLTTFIMLPFALLFGMLAGYFPGIIDDAIQYVYITLSSIPAILLIAAAVVSLQMKIETNPDLKLLLLCMILGLTSWTSLCRYVRGETLKLRDSEFIQAAITLGTTKTDIFWRHVLPNLMHIVIITLVLDFSGLVLAEAVLTYIGVGVDSATYSWGTMINAARLEMGRDPIVWWSLSGALILMFSLVFSANIFSEAVQEAVSPRRD